MALMQKLFQMDFSQDNYFHYLMAQMEKEFERAQRDMDAARNLLFQLAPRNQHDVTTPEIVPTHPVVEERGETKLKLEFNVKKFQPDEVEVKLMGTNILQVKADHKEETEAGTQVVHYMSQYRLPEGVDIDKIKPKWMKDGVLVIEAPAPALKPSEKLIPIDFK